MMRTSESRTMRCLLAIVGAAAGLFPALNADAQVAPAAEPVVAGLAAPGLTPELRGLILIEELNCAACHAAGGALAERSKKAPRLADVGRRANPAFVKAFIRDPHGTKPGTTMPDVLARLPAAERAVAARELTHFLLSLKPSDFAPQAPDPVAAAAGHRLFQARGCAACHAPRDEQAAELPSTNAVPLGPLEQKYSHASLVTFLRAPLASRPSGRMPDLRLEGRDAERIAHFLLQNTRVPGGLRYTLYRGDVWGGLQGENVAAERGGQVADFALASLGRVDQHSAVRYEGWLNVAAAGRHRFFLTMNGGTLVVDGTKVVEEAPSDQRGVKRFEAALDLAAGPHAIELLYFHTGRQAEFVFELESPQLPRGPVPAGLLSVSREPVAPFAPPPVEAALAARGRERFSALGCANCHDDLKIPGRAAPAWPTLDPARGCLADQAGPRFGLGAAQRAWIAQALPTALEPRLDATQRIHRTLAALNCIACHDRVGLGGPALERRALFTTTQPALGDQGRVPPPLTQVGAKLTPSGLEAVLWQGRRTRDYMDAAMPQYGEAQVAQLPALFAQVDRLEDAPVPGPVPLAESKAAGHELVGATGLGCIACHAFNGQKAGELSALDLAQAPQVLHKNWFALFLRQPSRFHSTIIMPGFWPGGVSTRTNVLNGDTARQIEAIWNYLADGERAKKPAGLSRQSSELKVGDVAEICRGRGSAAGFRGIGVGYPERVNLAFDATEMSLRMLWRGAFAGVDLGSFHPRGTDQIVLPPGVPFHRLASADAGWPSKGKLNHAFPQDHGYAFRGYTLDEKRRPTFRYVYGDVGVEDFFEDVRGEDGRGFFRRTLRLTAPAAPAPFHFRAAAGKVVEKISENTFRIDTLTLRLPSGTAAITREASHAELLLPLTLSPGTTTIVLDYLW